MAQTSSSPLAHTDIVIAIAAHSQHGAEGTAVDTAVGDDDSGVESNSDDAASVTRAVIGRTADATAGAFVACSCAGGWRAGADATRAVRFARPHATVDADDDDDDGDGADARRVHTDAGTRNDAAESTSTNSSTSSSRSRSRSRSRSTSTSAVVQQEQSHHGVGKATPSG